LKTLKCSIVIPAFQEGESIVGVLQRIEDLVNVDFECLVVIDFKEDSTKQYVEKFNEKHPRFQVKINNIHPGPANAIKSGINQSASDYVVVTMADGSDDPSDIEKLVRLLDRGVVIAAASRYMAGGQQVGAPFLKSALSRLAGISLFYLKRVGTKDATNSFKGYNKQFIKRVGIESTDGFEIGLELVAKARRLKLPVAEIPTIWIERDQGVSNFKIMKWLPKYMKWYFVALGLKKVKFSEGF
jgi:glycosyltransferase involved in cell wall biosynthesis